MVPAQHNLPAVLPLFHPLEVIFENNVFRNNKQATVVHWHLKFMFIYAHLHKVQNATCLSPDILLSPPCLCSYNNRSYNAGSE